MAELNLKSNIDGDDDFCTELLVAHEGMSKEESDAFNARLILILFNQIGDRKVIKQALKAASVSNI